jgi:Sec7-like guanine-nucleotide exchange factor
MLNSDYHNKKNKIHRINKKLFTEMTNGSKKNNFDQECIETLYDSIINKE